MTPDEFIDVVGNAYGEPTGKLGEALFDLVHMYYDQTESDQTNAENLVLVLSRLQVRLSRVTSALSRIR